MVDAPGVRELKVEHGFQAHDGKLAASWTEDLTADSTRYRRGITLEELNRMAGEVPLNFSASSFRDTVELPLRRHLSSNLATSLTQISCFLNSGAIYLYLCSACAQRSLEPGFRAFRQNGSWRAYHLLTYH